MAEDIRFSKKAATLTHASARGKVKRNAGNFTRGSQLFHHEILMTWAGIRMPLYVWVGTAVLLLCILVSLTFKNHEVQLVLMKLYAEAWGWVQLNPNKPVNLTLPSGQMVQGTMSMVPYHPAVERAWAKAVQVSISAGLGAAFICVPLTVWFVDFSKRRGTDILTERHERGAVLVTHGELAKAITSHNWNAHVSECRKRRPAVDPDKILAEPLKDRVRAGLHAPYRLAGVPVPWRLEQSHAMFIGTTGAGKTTELKKIVTQARERGHRCVIFDLTGTFVESFYDAETDIILNPMDRRCVPWSIFNDCDNYAEFMSAATALVPSGHSAEDDFWQKSARTLAYAINMHQAQGDTRDMAIGEMHSSARHLSNQRLALVMMTRVRDDITIVTNDRDRLLAQIDRNPGDKTSALETLGEKQVEAKRSGREAGEFRPTIPDHLRAPEDRQASASRIDPASLRATPQLDVPERNIERSR